MNCLQELKEIEDTIIDPAVNNTLTASESIRELQHAVDVLLKDHLSIVDIRDFKYEHPLEYSILNRIFKLF